MVKKIPTNERKTRLWKRLLIRKVTVTVPCNLVLNEDLRLCTIVNIKHARKNAIDHNVDISFRKLPATMIH